jgi:nucleotide-binding universal stress UspA family protein
MKEQSIILGYDGSSCSAAALDEAAQLAHDLAGDEIVVVYCKEPPAGLNCDLDPACAAARELRHWQSQVREDAEPMLHEAAARLAAAGVQAQVQVIWDEPVHGLTQAAADHESRAIVVGSHGKGPLAARLRRRTPQELLRRSSVPVLVVPFRS